VENPLAAPITNNISNVNGNFNTSSAIFPLGEGCAHHNIVRRNGWLR
jgi:hypothetical protein